MRRFALLSLALCSTGCPDEAAPPLTPASVPFTLRADDQPASLEHVQGLRKISGTATLRITLRTVRIEVTDEGTPPDPASCAWAQGFGPWCFDEAGGVLDLELAVRTAEATLDRRAGQVRLVGQTDSWDPDAFMTRGSAFWDEGDFDVAGGRMALAVPVVVDVDLSAVPVGGEITVALSARATVHDRLSGAAVSVVVMEGEVTTAGLDTTETVLDDAPEPTLAGPCGASPGTLSFDSATYFAIEGTGRAEPVVVRRSGGTDGVVSVKVTTAAQSAHGGEDYLEEVTVVTFGDGDDVPRLVPLAIVADQMSEPDETLALSLSDPACAQLGGLSEAELTILGIEPPLSDFALGGEISGLAGGAVTLRFQGIDQTYQSNGPFTWSRRFLAGEAYDVRLVASPSTQSCALTGGTGTFPAADVTDLRVICVDVAPNEALDPGFGVAGKVFSTSTTNFTAIALAPDGKIVGVRGLCLVRFLADGSPDLDFGTAGKACVQFSPMARDELFDLAVQADGKVVAVGRSQDHVALARFLDDGGLDPDFGTGGKVVTVVADSRDSGERVALQEDGRIVVGGNATRLVGGISDTDFAVSRFLTDGSVDVDFGTGGRTTTTIAGRTDLVQAIALQPDGKILLGGRVGVDGGAPTDCGVVRYLANGAIDVDFDGDGIVRLDLSGRGEDDVVADLAVQPGGEILVASPVSTVDGYQFGLTRLLPTGAQDATFGLVLTAFSTELDFLRAMTVQPDGKIVLVGERANLSSNPDFAVARFLTDGSPDGSFHDGGKLVIDFFGKADGAAAVLVQPDGKIVVAGTAQSTSFQGALVRILP